MLRSPLARAILLTALALAILETVLRATLNWSVAIVATILFWFVIEGIQRWFTWIELASLARTGTLEDYTNSGLTRADVALGLLYPAEVASSISVLMILGWFFFNTDNETLKLILIVFAALRAKSIADPPAMSLPDVEGYLRRRGPVALIFISAGVLVPLVAWFSVLYAFIFLVGIGLTLLQATTGIAAPNWLYLVLPIVLAWLVMLVVWNLWFRWRLRRFYARHGSFEEMYDRYVEGA